MLWNCCNTAPAECLISLGIGDVDGELAFDIVSGTWTHPSNTTSAHAIMVTKSHITGSNKNWQSVKVDCKSSQEGDCCRLMWNYRDPDNYRCLEVEFADLGGSARTIYRFEGVETIVGDDVPMRWLVPNMWTRLEVWHKGSYADSRCMVTQMGQGAVAQFRREVTGPGPTTFSGGYSAIGTGAMGSGSGGAGEAEFADHEFHRHYAKVDNCNPPSCIIHQELIRDSAGLLPGTLLQDWEEVIGTWGSSPEGHMFATSAGECLAVSRHGDFLVTNTPDDPSPEPRHNYRVAFDTIPLGGGVVFDYVDVDNYHRINLMETSSGAIEQYVLIKRTAGVETVVHAFDLGGATTLGDPWIEVDNPATGDVVNFFGETTAATLHGGDRFGFWVENNPGGSVFTSWESWTYALMARTHDELDRPCAVGFETCTPCTIGVTPFENINILLAGLSGTITGCTGGDCDSFELMAFNAQSCGINDIGGTYCGTGGECGFYAIYIRDCSGTPETDVMIFRLETFGAATVFATVYLYLGWTSPGVYSRGQMVWQKSMGSAPIDCAALDGEVLPLLVNSNSCNATGSTATLVL